MGWKFEKSQKVDRTGYVKLKLGSRASYLEIFDIKQKQEITK